MHFLYYWVCIYDQIQLTDTGKNILILLKKIKRSRIKSNKLLQYLTILTQNITEMHQNYKGN